LCPVILDKFVHRVPLGADLELIEFGRFAIKKLTQHTAGRCALGPAVAVPVDIST